MALLGLIVCHEWCMIDTGVKLGKEDARGKITAVHLRS
jgi:hypothetical protein